MSPFVAMSVGAALVGFFQLFMVVQRRVKSGKALKALTAEASNGRWSTSVATVSGGFLHTVNALTLAGVTWMLYMSKCECGCHIVLMRDGLPYTSEVFRASFTIAEGRVWGVDGDVRLEPLITEFGLQVGPWPEAKTPAKETSAPA